MVRHWMQLGVVVVLAVALLIQGLATSPLGEPAPAVAQESALSCSAGYALWADNLGGGAPALDWSGGGTHVTGKVHSNRDILLSGSDNVITGVVEYVTSFSDEGDGNQYPPPVQVSPGIMPVSYNIADYQPGGAAAVAAEQEGRYHYIDGDFEVSDGNVQLDGLYFVTGQVKLSGSELYGEVTIVAQREIEISGSQQNFTPYSGGLLLFSERSAQSGPAIKISGSDSALPGIIYAPFAQIEVSGSTNSFAGGLYGRTLRLNGSSLTITFDPQYCPPEPPPPTPTPPRRQRARRRRPRRRAPCLTSSSCPSPSTASRRPGASPTIAAPRPTRSAPALPITSSPKIRSIGTTSYFPEAGNVTVRLANFVPLEGQISVWRGDSCNATTFLQNNGDSALEKTTLPSARNQPAATSSLSATTASLTTPSPTRFW
jgi:hypothetical protein